MTARSIARGLAILLLAAAGAHAQPFRTYLASTGVDGPTCGLAAPCRLLPAALAAVADGGEVWILDSANFNTATVTISRSVTILAVPGALGSVLSTPGAGLVINTPGVEVTLRNLVFVPLPGTGTHGVAVYAGVSLTVQDCTFANMPTSGIYADGALALRVVDSTFRNNSHDGVRLFNGARATVTGSTFSGNGEAGVGVRANTSGASLTSADIADSIFNANNYAVWTSSLGTGPAATTVRDSYIVGNGTGLTAYSYGGAPTSLSASNNLISNTLNHGLDAYQAGSRILTSGNTIVNTTGPAIRNGGGIVETAGDNAVNHNAYSNNGPVGSVSLF